ncbi:hypothetical protein MTO96_008393 [Rhipicephalus appendiculatus]
MPERAGMSEGVVACLQLGCRAIPGSLIALSTRPSLSLAREEATSKPRGSALSNKPATLQLGFAALSKAAHTGGDRKRAAGRYICCKLFSPALCAASQRAAI